MTTPTSTDLTAERCLQRLATAQERGEDIHPHVIAVYEAFARDGAERWYLNCHAGAALEPHAARLAELALHDQLEVVPRLNAEYFSRPDRAFDRTCCAAVRRAFHDRARELRAGWSL